MESLRCIFTQIAIIFKHDLRLSKCQSWCSDTIVLLKLKNNIDVCFSVSESQVTAPGTGVSIYGDLTTSWVATGMEPSNDI